MELIKNLNIGKNFKKHVDCIFWNFILTISAKIKNTFLSCTNDNANFCSSFLGIAFGFKIATATVILYLIEGIIGMPVFSNSPEKGVGLIYFTGPTMGYLIGFLIGAFFSGYFNLKRISF